MTLQIRLMCALALVGVLIVGADAHGSSCTRQGKGGVLTVVMENDLFGGTDRHYSNGVRLEWVAPRDQAPDWLRQAARAQPFVALKGCDLRVGYAISHTLYTASDITLQTPPPDDHPYAGHISLNWFATARTDQSEHTVMVDIGLIGPSAQGEFVQSHWHQLIDGAEPRGWDNQLHDEVVFALSGQRADRVLTWQSEQFEADLLTHAGLTLGTLRTDVSLGATVRIGFDLGADFAPPRLRPALTPSSLYSPNAPVGGYLFAGFGGYWVGRDVFLDGNTFRDSASVDRRQWVGDLQAGAALQLRKYRFAFTYVVRSEQYKGQNGPQRFGAVSLSRTF